MIKRPKITILLRDLEKQEKENLKVSVVHFVCVGARVYSERICSSLTRHQVAMNTFEMYKLFRTDMIPWLEFNSFRDFLVFSRASCVSPCVSPVPTWVLLYPPTFQKTSRHSFNMLYWNRNTTRWRHFVCVEKQDCISMRQGFGGILWNFKAFQIERKNSQ